MVDAEFVEARVLRQKPRLLRQGTQLWKSGVAVP